MTNEKAVEIMKKVARKNNFQAVTNQEVDPLAKIAFAKMASADKQLLEIAEFVAQGTSSDTSTVYEELGGVFDLKVRT